MLLGPFSFPFVSVFPLGILGFGSQTRSKACFSCWCPLLDSRPPCRPAIRRLSFQFTLSFLLDASCHCKPMTSHHWLPNSSSWDGPERKRSDSRGHSSQGYYNHFVAIVAACESAARTQLCMSFRSKFHRGLEFVLKVRFGLGMPQ